MLYHSLSATDGDFIRFLDVVNLLVVKSHCVMVGDYNIDLMSESFYARKLRMEMACLRMKQYIDRPTRITKNSKTIIDLVFVNKKVNCIIHHKPKITDHSWISIELNSSDGGCDKYREFVSRDYSKFCSEEFCRAIENRLEYKEDLDVNTRAEILVQNIIHALNLVSPKKKFRIPKVWEGKKWYSDDLRITTKKGMKHIL